MERVFDLDAVLAQVREALEAGRIDEAVRLGIDPALVSNPLMSTMVDATGLLIYLQIAKAILRI